MAIKTSISRWSQYLYFLRVSLIVWAFLPIFCFLDFTGVTATLSRGIVTLDSRWQVFYAAFLVVAVNMSVLITARNTVRNGLSRFDSIAPDSLYRVLTDSNHKVVWLVLGVAHIPTLLTLVYLEAMTAGEGEQIHLPALLAGLVAALVFWYLVTLFYYWTYRSSDADNLSGEVSSPAALLFPKYDFLFGDIADSQPPPRLMSCIDLLTVSILSSLSCTGYAKTTQGPVWELHFLSVISLIGIFVLYLFLYPLTGPIAPTANAVAWQISLCCFTTGLFLALIADAQDKTSSPDVKSRWAKRVKGGFILLAMTLAVLFIFSILFDYITGSVRLASAFPTIGSIVILLCLSLWFLSGAAFFLDRYRLPVLLAVLSVIFLPKLIAPSVSEFLVSHGRPWLAQVFDSDHFYTVKPLKNPIEPAQFLTPAEVLNRRVSDATEPYIIVTASGGGIQAAEWTSQVLASLEKEFANDWILSRGPKPYSFHEHLVLSSGVSGGSVGLMPFLLEYTARDSSAFPTRDPDLYDRITRPAGCSSLEAVGWGLSYHDLYRLIAPMRLPLSLANDSAPDRSWALAAAFNRNLHDEHCRTNRDETPGHENFAHLPRIRDGNGFTLYDAARRLAEGKFPAFTFNTTAAETGSRFLLSNYRVPTGSTCGSDFTPAESFLQVYAAEGIGCNKANGKPLLYADLPLAVAARMSATFPVVSSGTRIPPAYTDHAYHFLDGGYFDNDGTASAIEFLKSALDDPTQQGRPHKILLVEIRDDDGTNVDTDSDDLAKQNEVVDGALRAPPWTPLTQLTGVAEGLWNAGHVSISRRNRRELCILQRAYRDRGLDIHHVVFTIPAGTDHLSPLSWNLTSGQLASITGRVRTEETRAIIRESIQWVRKAQENRNDPGEDLCRPHVERGTFTPLGEK